MLISKVVHRIWLGPHPMPDIYREYGESWKRHGWHEHLWTEANLPPVINQDIWDEIGEGVNTGGGIPDLGVWVQRADMLEYELILQYGGIYANCDIELLRPLDDLLADVRCFAGMEDDTFVGSALIGAVPRHRLLQAIVAELPRRYRRLRGHPMNVQTGPHLLTDMVRRGFTDVTIFPREHFYPWHYSHPDAEDLVPATAYTNHHWGHTKPDLVGGVSDG